MKNIIKKPRKTALQKHLSVLGKKGGASTLEKHGKDHFKKMAEKRHSK